MSEHGTFRDAVSRFTRELGLEIHRLGADAQRLRDRGNPTFAAELLALRDRLHEIRCYAQFVLSPHGTRGSAKAPPPSADVCEPGET